MTYFTGISGKLQFYDGSTNYSSIGAVEEFVKTFRVRRTETDGIATRKRYRGRITEVIPSFNLKYNLQEANLLTSYLVKSDEGSLSKFALRYFDGQEYGEVYNIAPDTVEVATGHGRPISVNLAGIAENTSKGLPTITWASDAAFPPLTWRDTATLTIFGTNVISHFREWNFRCNNNALSDITGNVIRPASVHWGKADYTGRIEIAKSISSFEDLILNASRGSVVIAFTDHQAAPVTKTFTFEVSDLVQAEVRMPMDLIIQRIEFASNSLTIT